jgi:hypothetical protein
MKLTRCISSCVLSILQIWLPYLPAEWKLKVISIWVRQWQKKVNQQMQLQIELTVQVFLESVGVSCPELQYSCSLPLETSSLQLSQAIPLRCCIISWIGNWSWQTKIQEGGCKRETCCSVYRIYKILKVHSCGKLNKVVQAHLWNYMHLMLNKKLSQKVMEQNVHHKR